MQVARAKAEGRRAAAIALEQEMIATVQEKRAEVIRNEAEIPKAISAAFREGHIHLSAATTRNAGRSPSRCPSCFLGEIGRAKRLVGALSPAEPRPIRVPCRMSRWMKDGFF